MGWVQDVVSESKEDKCSSKRLSVSGIALICLKLPRQWWNSDTVVCKLSDSSVTGSILLYIIYSFHKGSRYSQSRCIYIHENYFNNETYFQIQDLPVQLNTIWRTLVTNNELSLWWLQGWLIALCFSFS